MPELPAPRRHFASDNFAGAHPEVLAALAAANVGHASSYGSDGWTARAEALLREQFGSETAPFLVFNGTAANVVGLATLLRPSQSVLCAETSHLNVDECGAPERFIGCKLVAIPAPEAKLTPASVAPQLKGFGFVHHSQPGAISITQATEYGTIYTPAEVRALADLAHANKMILHMDGARIANAAATLGVPLRAFTTDAGVDIVSFGGTKNGLLAAEAVIFRDQNRAAEFGYVRKQGMQLASKMRFVSAQIAALLENGLWLKSATHANAMARRLEQQVRNIPGLTITQKVEANAVFARVPREWIAPLQERAFFYVWDETGCEVRWMTSFDTTPDDVDRFGRAVAEVAGARV